MEGEFRMRISRITQDMKGFQVISATDGQVIGKVEDVYIDLKNLHVAAIATSTGGILSSKVEAIPRKDIKVWGEDVILVDDPNVILDHKKIKGFDEWDSVLDHVKNKDVLNTKGEQIATLNDVVIDSDANIVGYDLSNVLMDGPVSKSKRINVNATKAFGPDALIIDTSKILKWEI
jgi:uncharacterized protein YrrD